jgi:hypothetical protein
MGSEPEDAWDALHAVTPPGWYIGRPSYHLERDEWLLYAFDPSARPGRRSEPGVDGDSVDGGRRGAGDGEILGRAPGGTAEVTHSVVGGSAVL